MQTETAQLTEFFGDMISLYSREDAIRDGVLVQVSPELCKDAGVVLPVCVTDTVWNGYLDPANMAEMPGQSVEGRTWDLLWMFRTSVKSGDGARDRIRYSVLFQMIPGKEPEEVSLIAVCSPGDEGEPVITIMLPGED